MLINENKTEIYEKMVEKDGGALCSVPRDEQTFRICHIALYAETFTYNKKIANLDFELEELDEPWTEENSNDPDYIEYRGNMECDYSNYCEYTAAINSLPYNEGDQIDNFNDRLKFVSNDTIRKLCEKQ